MKKIILVSMGVLLTITSNAYASKLTRAVPHAKQVTPSIQAESFTVLPSKKIGNGVVLGYRLDDTPQVGKPLIVYISINSPADAQVTPTVREGLLLSNPNQVMLSKAGLSTEHSVTLVPQSEGRFYLNLLSVANGHGAASGIVIQVGNKTTQMKAAGKVQTNSAGERIVVMPAK
jgi:hypothetical protein